MRTVAERAEFPIHDYELDTLFGLRVQEAGRTRFMGVLEACAWLGFDGTVLATAWPCQSSGRGDCATAAILAVLEGWKEAKEGKRVWQGMPRSDPHRCNCYIEKRGS